jgi:hypothetical protein
VVLLSYTTPTATGTEPKHRLQRIWIRQGEEADYLFSQSEPTTPMASRPLARKWVPYNLTAAKFNGKGVVADAVQLRDTEGNSWVDVRPGGAPSIAEFTDYPTQAGAFFKWADSYEGVRAYNPTGRPMPATNWDWKTNSGYVTAAWNGANVTLNGNTGTVSQLYESCPEGYRRPTVGRTDVPIDVSTPEESEVLQSLFLDPYAEGDSNSIRGYYADGFFDRRQTVVTTFESTNATVSIVSSGNSTLAGEGRLLYNTATSSSLFLPYHCYRHQGNGELNYGTEYWLANSDNMVPTQLKSAWAFSLASNQLIAPKPGKGQSAGSHHEKRFAFFIRCVKALSPVSEENPGSNHVLYFDIGSDGKGMVRVGRWLGSEDPNNPGADKLTSEDHVLNVGHIYDRSKLAYFKAGGVIGVNRTGTDYATNVIEFNPSTLAAGTYITNYESIPYYGMNGDDNGINNVSTATYHTAANIAKGKGDPCKLAGLTVTEIQAGKIDNGLWRLPTHSENMAFSGGANSSSYSGTGFDTNGVGWFNSDTAQGVSLPATGSRQTYGSPENYGYSGSYWSSTVTWSSYNLELKAQLMNFNSSTVQFVNNSPAFGLTIRCVRQAMQ